MPTDLPLVGSPSLLESRKQTWVQTERSSHEAWAVLVRTKPRAASLLHTLVAHMDHQSAIVASRATLASLENCSEATIKRAVAELKQGSWIEVVQVGGKGGVNAYVVNSRVAWADKRDRLPTAIFTATVITTADEQEQMEATPLRRIPTLYPGEAQLPTGNGVAPPAQPELGGIESDLPALRHPESIDQATGEISFVKRLRGI